MQSKTIFFSIIHEYEWFHVEFESESPVRNLLMGVIYNGFPLDTAELRLKQPLLYSKVKRTMEEAAIEEWSHEDDFDPKDIPTLAYQKKIEKKFDLFGTLGKILAPVVLVLLLSTISIAQKNDTIWVKKVFLNAKLVKVKKGYVVHKGNQVWEVNGKDVKLWVYKPTTDPDFKPDSIAKK